MKMIFYHEFTIQKNSTPINDENWKSIGVQPSMMEIGMLMNVTIETKTQTPMLHLGHGSQT
jgi:hypothetical protein